MKTEVYICVLCACLVTLGAQKTPASNGINDFTFLSYNATQGSEGQGPSSNVLVNGSKHEQMTNHTFLNITNISSLERIILPKPAESEWPKNETQDIAQV